MRLGLCRGRECQDLRRDDALREVVEPLEARTTRGRGDVARPEQPLEHPLRLAPLPPTRAATLQLRGGKGSVILDALEQPHRLHPPLVGEDPQAPIARHSPIGSCHSPSKERLEREREKRGLGAEYSNRRRSPLGPQAARLRSDLS